MPTPAISNLLKISIGSTPVALACLTQSEFSAQLAMRDVSCFDDDEYENSLPGKKSAKLSGSGLWAFDAGSTSNALVAHTNLKAGTKVNWSFGSGETGDPEFSGEGYFGSFKASGSGNFENAQYSFEITVVGEWSQGTY